MDIYQFDDFRAYLQALVNEKKNSEPSFSYRNFAIHAGIKNPGYLVDVIKGKRSISKRIVESVIDIFKISPPDASYFKLLVEYGQAKKDDLKQQIYTELVRRRNKSSFVKINPGQVRYYDDTLYPLIIAALQIFEFKGNYETLATFFDPPVPASKLQKYIVQLCEWGLVKQNENGSYVAVHQFLEPPPELRHCVKRINRDWILQSADAHFKFTPDERHVSTVLLSLSKTAREKIFTKIEELRSEIFEIVKSDHEKADQVMQLSLLFFPKSRSIK